MAGFSITYPLGWGGTPSGSGRPGESNFLRLAPERKTGRETSMNVLLMGTQAPKTEEARAGTFQGQPASYSANRGKRDWYWRVQFQRDANWYQITLVSPIELEVEKGDYWPYINSFRLEKPMTPATMPLE